MVPEMLGRCKPDIPILSSSPIACKDRVREVYEESGWTFRSCLHFRILLRVHYRSDWDSKIRRRSPEVCHVSVSIRCLLPCEALQCVVEAGALRKVLDSRVEKK